MFIHLQFYFRNLLFTCGDLNFDWLFFIKFDEIEHVLSFSKFDQADLIKTKTCQVLLYTLSNLFDSMNLTD